MNKKKSLLIFCGIIVFVVLIIVLITVLGSGGGYKILASGLQFKMVLNKSTEKVKEGQLMVAFVTYKTEKDSVIFSTYSTPKKSTTFPVGKPDNIGDMNEAFLLLGPNDSALFMLPSDSIFKPGARRPAFAGKGTFIKVGIRVDTVFNKEDYSKVTMMQTEEQKVIDDNLIKQYLSDNKINADRSEDGLYYIIDKSGTGKNAAAGKSVSVLYTGMLLDGTIFDSSEKNGGAPFKVKLGSHAVISGWDKGLNFFNRGAKGRLFIPSYMAYGDKDYPGRIPSNSVLIFEIEVLDIK